VCDELIFFISCRQGYALTTDADSLKRLFYRQLKEFTCQGEAVSALAPCIKGGEVCSNTGNCTDGACACSAGKSGQFCESTSVVSSDSTTLIIGILQLYYFLEIISMHILFSFFINISSIFPLCWQQLVFL
jgi:hypothetical protein